MTRFAGHRLLGFLFAARNVGASLAVAVAIAVTPTEGRAQLSYSTFVSSGSLAGALSNNAVIGFAYAGNKFVGSVYFGTNNNQLYATDLNGTNVHTFGLPIPGFSGEIYVSSALGIGGFTVNNVFAGSEAAGTVYQVSNDGTSQGVFASGLVGGVRSIAFDPYGLYGNDMIVATNAGNIYRINSAGVATLLTNVGEDAEGLSFAPQAFGPLVKGTLVVASEGSGSLRAIDALGTKTTIATVAGGAEMVSFVPLNLGASGNSVEGFYAASYANEIVKVAANDFVPYLGQMIVTSENSHAVTRVFWDGSTFAQAGFNELFPAQPEDGIFVTTDIINLTVISTVPEPATVALLMSGLLGVAVFARRRRVA